MDIALHEETSNDIRLRSNSLQQKREKKSAFGDLFGMRSSSRDRKQAKRPMSDGSIKMENQPNLNPSTNEDQFVNGRDFSAHQALKKKETKSQSGFGSLFGSNKQRKQRSKSQERNKKTEEAQRVSDGALEEPERQGIENVADLLASNSIRQPTGTTLHTQNRHPRPMEKPPLPPAGASHKVIFPTPNFTNSPSPQQINSDNLTRPKSLDTSEMTAQNEDISRYSVQSNYSPNQPTVETGHIILNDSGIQGKTRQTGRQSGRFRKSSTLSNISGVQTTSSNLQRQTSFSSQATTNEAQSMFMDSIIADPQSRPITPHNPEPKKKVSSVSRTESYRRARGHEDERPRIVKRNDNYSSLPRSKKQVRNLRAANSEDSLRNAVNREENRSPSYRDKPRHGRKGKDGDCSLM